MKKHQREAILISFLNEKERYKKLAEYIVQHIGYLNLRSFSVKTLNLIPLKKLYNHLLWNEVILLWMN
jgi:hypothetical protein